jgi:hypothetical protein
MIPAAYLDERHRMRWEYIWDEDGKIRQEVLDMGFAPSEHNPNDLVRFLEFLFPFNVIPVLPHGVFDDDEATKLFDDWMTQHIGSGWQLWMRSSDMKKPIYYFESATDALHFKLRWS